MFKQAIPVLHVASAVGARAFCWDMLGFALAFSNQVDESQDDPCCMGLVRDDAWLHVSSFPGDAVVGGVVYLLVSDLDELHRSLEQRDVAIDLPPTDQSWGNREMYVRDPDGNCIRFVQAQPS